MSRVVAITGASSGIGRAAALRFAARGDRVVACARTLDRLTELAARPEAGGRIQPRVADVADAASMERFAAETLADPGLPDVVVANAGIGMDAAFPRTLDAGLERVLAVNVVGVFRTLRPFVEPMVARGSGRLLVVSSIVGKRGTPYYSAYSASKFALHGMADALHAELVGTGVSLGLVCPASTETGFSDRALREGAGQKRVRPRRHSAESVAVAIERMAASRRREIVLGFEAKALMWADALAPKLVDRLLARILRNREDG